MMSQMIVVVGVGEDDPYGSVQDYADLDHMLELEAWEAENYEDFYSR